MVVEPASSSVRSGFSSPKRRRFNAGCLLSDSAGAAFFFAGFVFSTAAFFLRPLFFHQWSLPFA